MKTLKFTVLALWFIFTHMNPYAQEKKQNLKLLTYAGDKVEQIHIGKTYKLPVDSSLNIKEPWIYIQELKAFKLDSIDYQIGYYQFTFDHKLTNEDSLKNVFINVSINKKLVPLFLADSILGQKIPIDCQLKNPYYRKGIKKNHWILITFVLVIALLVYFIISSKTKILRDRIEGELSAPFSLSRTQLAFWTLIIILSYFIIWWKLGESLEITAQVLALLGISAGTTTLGHIIDTEDISDPKKVRHQESGSDEGFFSNIISDANGLSIHRLQNVIFNIAIGSYFLYEVWFFNEIPVLNANLVALMAISSGTYLAIKKGENKVNNDNN